jgi:hypothetical protein
VRYWIGHDEKRDGKRKTANVFEDRIQGIRRIAVGQATLPLTPVAGEIVIEGGLRMMKVLMDGGLSGAMARASAAM